MKKKISPWIKRFLILSLIALFIIQFFRIDKNNPVADSGNDFLNSSSVSEQVRSNFKAACYDCHSHESKYPWYTNIAPVSFWVKGHIDNGRKKLNFSLWNEYTEKKQHHKLEECIEEMEENHMPLKSYTWVHPEARLSQSDKDDIIGFIKQKMKSLE